MTRSRWQQQIQFFVSDDELFASASSASQHKKRGQDALIIKLFEHISNSLDSDFIQSACRTIEILIFHYSGLDENLS
jgi:hypothetical protein